MEMEPASGVIAIDSVPLFRDGLARVVTAAPGLCWVGGAYSEVAAVALCRWARPDIALIESAMDRTGELTRNLRNRYGVKSIVVLVDVSNHALVHAAAAIQSGANAVVSRCADTESIVRAIRLAHEGRRYVDNRLVRIDPTHSPAEHSDSEPLTEREHQVLQLVSAGLSTAEAAVLLYITKETVRTHLQKAFRKLGARNRGHAMTIAFRHGLIDSSGVIDAIR